MSREMETAKQKIIKGESYQREFTEALKANEALPEDERVSDAAVAWKIAKATREALAAR